MRYVLKKIMSGLMAMAMVFALLPLGAVPAEASLSNNHTTSFSGGDGSQSDPWRISTAADMWALADDVNTIYFVSGHYIAPAIHYPVYYVVTNDIDLGASPAKPWIPMGHAHTGSRYAFEGVFDGGGHTISGLYVNGAGMTCPTDVGLFGLNGGFSSSIGATVKNLTVEGTIHIIGDGQPSVRHSAPGDEPPNASYVGGIVGWNWGTIDNCEFRGSITADGRSAAGIAGENLGNGIIRNSRNYGTINGNRLVGGITGVNYATVENCYNAGSISSSFYQAGTVTGLQTGGIAGHSRGVIRNSYNIGNVTSVFNGVGAAVGGISGVKSLGEIENCYNTGNISAQGNEIGGIAGRISDSSIYNCYNTGNISGNDQVGGIIGWFMGGGSIQNSLSLGASVTSGGANTGRVTGQYDAGTLANNHACADMLVSASGAGATVTGASGDRHGADLALGTPQSAVFGGWSGWNIPNINLNPGDALPTLNTITQSPPPILPPGISASPQLNTVIIDNTGADFSVGSDNIDRVARRLAADANIGVTDFYTFTLKVNETNESAVGGGDILAEARGRILQFFDITVTERINEGPETTLTELPIPIQVIIDLSHELSGKTGYSVYRYHNNEVQLLGIDTGPDEFFSILRGTGAGGVDQVKIHSKGFSTYAVVGRELRLYDPDYEDVDVQARIIDGREPVYRIDIAWGDMKFEYALDTLAWRASGFDGVNNNINITNRSNADVRVSVAVTENGFSGGFSGPVEMSIYTANTAGGVPAVNLPLGKVPAELAAPLSLNAYLWLNGDPSAADLISLKTALWNQVGVITVTVTPDGEELTPRG